MKPWNSLPWSFEGDDRARVARTRLDDGGELSVRFLSDAMARVTLRPGGGWREPRTWAIAPGADVPWEGREREDLSGFELPATRAAEGRFSTDQLTVTLQSGPLRLQWHAFGDSTPIAQDRETAAYLRQSRGGLVRHYLARDPRERYYGLGDKTGPLDLHGRRLRTAALDALGYDPEHGDPLYKHWPFVMSRSANGQWLGIYYDTVATCTFDLGCEHDNYHGFYRYVEIEDGDLDYYLMVGRTPAEVVSQFVHLIGGTHLPPRWTLGFGQTAMGLPDAPDAQARLTAFMDEAVSHRVPISVYHYGSGYSSRGKRRYVFTWNRSKFSDPKALNERFHSRGMRLVANLKPCLLDDHPAYGEVKAMGAFIADARSGEPVLEPFWDGQGSHLDFTKPEAVRWWQEGLKRQVLDYGIDVGWNDNNEYAIQDEDAQCAGFGRPIPMHRARALQGLLMTRATFEAQREHAPQDAVFTVTRAGMPGIQRYAQTWSGDNTTSWRTLRWNIRTGLQMSLSGMFNIGHDVGGFYGALPEPELLLRWVQACSLNPRMVMNSWKEGLTRQVLDSGVDAGWNDNNEYGLWDDNATSQGFGEPTPLALLRPVQALLMTRATREAQLAAKSTLRPFTITRAGGPGLQRYAQTWSGDNTTSWESLKWNFRTGLGMSLSGMFNIGHDVGGFYGALPEPELLLRWVQACSLNPRMVMNSWKEGGITTVPWIYPEVTPAITRAIELRYRLMPYLWSLFERASAQHEPIIRPTFYDFPDDARCLEDCDDFMLGRQLLVAPVVEAGATTRRVYLPALPEGQRWFDFETGEAFVSRQWHTVAAPLERLPLFAREGAAIPCAQPAPGQVARHDDPVVETRHF